MTNQHFQFAQDRSFEEKRNLKRIDLEAPMSIKVAGKSENINCICKNLSGEGICIESDVQLNIDEKVEICVNSSNDKVKSLRAIAVIVRSSLNSNSNKFLSSGKIIEFI